MTETCRNKVTVMMLRPTASKKWRRATFVRVTDAGGVLQVDEAARGGLKVSARRYLVREVEVTEDGRVFRLTKPSDVGGHYDVLLSGRHNGYDVCNCVAHEKFGDCVHCEAIRTTLTAEGV